MTMRSYSQGVVTCQRGGNALHTQSSIYLVAREGRIAFEAKGGGAHDVDTDTLCLMSDIKCRILLI